MHMDAVKKGFQNEFEWLAELILFALKRGGATLSIMMNVAG